MLIKHCKVGTMPTEIVRLRYHYRLTVGRTIKFQSRSFGGEWECNWREGCIWRINPDGLLFLELM